MTEISEVFERERKECEDAIDGYEWTCSALQEAAAGTTCPKCASSLIEPLGDSRRPDVRCRSCGETSSFENFAEYAMRDYFDNEHSIRDGGSPDVVMCPNCSSEAYHFESEICAVCEESVEHECMKCGSSIIPEELDDDGMCGYCRHVSMKDD